MDRENKAELGANLIKLGLAIVSVMCPQAGIASATIDLALSVINSSELLKEPSGNDVNLQLRKCITDVINRIRSRNHTATHKQLIEMYIIPRYELWLSTGDARVLQDGDIDRLFREWIDNKEAQREMYLTETDIQKINELFIELLKEELFKYPNLASWYGYHQINTLDQRFRTQYIDLVKRMNELESQLQEFIKTKNPKVEVILGKELSEQLWYASKTEYGIAKQKGNRFAYDIIERLLPNGYIPKLAVPIEGKMEEGENYPLMELYNATNEHVAIIGNGGSGKTTFLQHLMSKAFSDEMTYSPGAQIPVFIELNRCPADIGLWYDELLGKTNFITRYIGTLLENHAMLDAVDSRMLAYIEKEFQKRPENGKPQYVLLLDGFNEVRIDEGYGIRSILSNEISMVKKYPNVRIVTTSRETQAAYYATDFINIRLPGLKETDIIDYLRQCGKPEYIIGEVNKNKQLMECLKVPLYLCMFASNNHVHLLPETQGEILYFFFHRDSAFYSIRKRSTETRSNPLNELQTKVVLDFILPYVAYCLDQDDVFSVSDVKFEQQIIEAVTCIKHFFLKNNHNPFADFQYSGICLEAAVDSLVDDSSVNVSTIIECMFDYLGIIYLYRVHEGHYKERTRYAFCHHSFRDYFSAIWHIQLLRMLPAIDLQCYSDTGKTTGISYNCVLNKSFWAEDKVVIISEILMEHRNKPYMERTSGDWYLPEPTCDEQTVLVSALDTCRSIGKEIDVRYLVDNLLSAIVYGRGEFTLLNLQELDLAHSNFFNAICSRKGRHRTVGADFSHSTLVEDCFYPQDHQDNIIEYVYHERKCITVDDSGLIKCWDVVSGKLEYELNSGDPVGNRDNSPRGYIKISRNKKWLGVKVQESLSSGMSIKLHIFDLDDPQKPPICLLPDVTHQVLSYFTFSDDSKCVALICDNKHVYFYDLSGKLLSRYVLRNLYANNELHFAERQSSVYIFSYDYNPFFYGEGFDECSEYDDNPIEGDEDRHGIPCVICKLCTATGETTELHTFYGAAETIPTVSYIPGTDAFLIYDGDKKQIEHFNCCTMKRTPIFMSVSPEAQEPPAALHLYADNPTICLLMYSDYAYLCDYEKELSGQYGILKQFTTSGIQKKLKEKGLGVDLHFSTNVAPSDNHFLVFDENNKTYEWDSESDIVRARYNSAFYDTAYLAVSSGRDNAFLVHAYNGISQFASDPLVLHYQHCYREKGYSVNVGASDELRNQLALAFADVGHEKVIVVDLDTYAERLIFSTMKPSETITDLCFSDEGEKILITTQYRCVEFDFKTEHEATVAQSTGKERFTYGNYSGAKIEIVVVEESEEGLPTRCEYYSKTEIDGKVEFQKEWYYVIPQLPEKLYKYFVHGNGDFGKEGLRGENGIQKYWLTRGFFLEDWSEFEPVMLLECYRRSGDDFVMSKVQFKRLDMICVRHESTLAPTRNRKNSITYMYLNIENNEAIFSRNSADLAWENDLSKTTYESIGGVFERHIGNEKGYYSWNYVIPWNNNKMLGCFETFQITLIDSSTGEQSNLVEYHPGLSLCGCNFTNIRANNEVKALLKNSGGII